LVQIMIYYKPILEPFTIKIWTIFFKKAIIVNCTIVWVKGAISAKYLQE
jgi:hypothetical protein